MPSFLDMRSRKLESFEKPDHGYWLGPGTPHLNMNLAASDGKLAYGYVSPIAIKG